MARIPSKSSRKSPIAHDRGLYRQLHKTENMFGRLKDWRRLPYSLRSMRTHLHVSHLRGCHHHLLALINES